jgi:hypothetical protein
MAGISHGFIGDRMIRKPKHVVAGFSPRFTFGTRWNSRARNTAKARDHIFRQATEIGEKCEFVV